MFAARQRTIYVVGYTTRPNKTLQRTAASRHGHSVCLVAALAELYTLGLIGDDRMKIALWIVGVLLVLDLLFVSYFHVFRASYYFPGRYEDALLPDLFALMFGLPLLVAFVVLLIDYLRRRKGPGDLV